MDKETKAILDAINKDLNSLTEFQKEQALRQETFQKEQARVANAQQEQTNRVLIQLTEIVAQQTQHEFRIDSHETVISNHDTRIRDTENTLNRNEILFEGTKKLAFSVIGFLLLFSVGIISVAYVALKNQPPQLTVDQIEKIVANKGTK